MPDVPARRRYSLHGILPALLCKAGNYFFLCRVKVLILHQHFKIPQSGGAIRSYYLARALVEKGIRVVVVTAHNAPDHKTTFLEGIEVHYLPVPYDNKFGFNKRIFAFYKFMVKSVRFSRRHHDADMCYAISTPLTTGVAAMILRRRYKMPYIFEVGDLWPDAPIEMGFVRNVFVQHLLYAMEKKIYRNAESVVALSIPIRDAISEKVYGKQIHMIPNMADTVFFRPEEKQPALEAKYGVEGRFVVSYIGAVGVANGLDFLIACAMASRREGLPLHFLVCGDGAMLSALRESAVKHTLKNVSFIPFTNRAGVAEILNITDATFISYQPFAILETGSPNKYFDGLAAGKMTIINFGGWIRAEIEGAGCGIYINPRQPEDFVSKIKPFLDDRSRLKTYQRRGRELAEQKYSRQLLSEKYWRILSAAG